MEIRRMALHDLADDLRETVLAPAHHLQREDAGEGEERGIVRRARFHESNQAATFARAAFALCSW